MYANEPLTWPESQEPIVTLSAEHQNYRWCSLEEIWDLPLISGANRCLEIVYKK